jgi:hypothetical protein
MSIDLAIAPIRSPRRRRLFFLGVSVALALIVFAGFAPSFYLREQFGRPPPPSTIVYAHGVLFTLWMAVLVLQTSLVAAGRIQAHRLMGSVGIALAFLMVIVGWFTQVDHTKRVIARGDYLPNRVLENFLFVTSVQAIVVFGALVSAAVYLRRRPETHKRLLICATVALVFPAFGRIPGSLTLGPLGPLILTTLLLVALVGYDITVRGRLHAATVWGGGAVSSLLVFASTPFFLSAPVDRFIQWVGR